MRVDLYPINEEKILQCAHKLGVSPTQLVNDILENVNIIVKVDIEKVDMTFSTAKLEAKEASLKPKKKKAGGKNFVTDW